jgi:predicted ArsR family transcriptional regulator
MRQKRGRILKILLIEKGVTMARLSKELEITNKATEEVVESLMKDGLISISKNKVIVINDN